MTSGAYGSIAAAVPISWFARGKLVQIRKPDGESAVRLLLYVRQLSVASTEDQRGSSAGDQQAADYLVCGEPFSEKYPREQDDQHHAEFVDGRDG
jgi:hypothetical protein